MYAFIDSPVQIAVVMIVVLLVFGPEKMKDIGKQLGRAIREVRRAGTDFRNTLEGDDTRYDADYRSPSYDSYNPSSDTTTDYNSHYSMPAGSEVDFSQAQIPAAPVESEHRGDFAAAAFGDTSEVPIDYSAPPTAAEPAAPSAPIYGVLATPEQTVPREKV